MKTLIEEYGDIILAVMVVVGICTTIYLILPLIKDTVIPYLESVGVL